MRSTFFGLLILLSSLSFATPPASFVPTENPDYFYGENLFKPGEFIFLHFEKGKLIYSLVGPHGNLKEKEVKVHSVVPGPGDAWYIKYRVDRIHGGHIIAVGGMAALLALKEEIGFTEAYKAARKNQKLQAKCATKVAAIVAKPKKSLEERL